MGSMSDSSPEPVFRGQDGAFPGSGAQFGGSAAAMADEVLFSTVDAGGEGETGRPPSAGGDLGRLTICGPATSVELAVPVHVPLVDLLPALAGHLGDSLADTGLEHAGWVLQRLGERPFREVQAPSTVGSQGLLHRLSRGPLFSSVLHPPAAPRASRERPGGARPVRARRRWRGFCLPVSSGRFIPPMIGGYGMGMGGFGGMPDQERERGTWLAEDEEIWGTDPGVGVGVLGRDVEDKEEVATFGEFTEQRGTRPRGGQPRQGFY